MLSSYRFWPGKHSSAVSHLLVFFACFYLLACSRSVYVVRHAEKAVSNDSLAPMMANDPPLSEAGKVRAIVLKNELLGKKIKHIYSTHTVRTKSTAEPLSQASGVRIQLYSNADSLVRVLQAVRGNSLVVGHANTVDEIINGLCRTTKLAGDLKDNEYDNLFLVKIRGKRAHFSRRKYGYPSNP